MYNNKASVITDKIFYVDNSTLANSTALDDHQSKLLHKYSYIMGYSCTDINELFLCRSITDKLIVIMVNVYL